MQEEEIRLSPESILERVGGSHDRGPLTAVNGGHQAVKILRATSMVCRQTINQVVNATSIFANLGGYAAPRWGVVEP